jgi:hypothetical protein
MSRIEVTGIPDFTKDRDQWFHHGPPESGKPSSESTFYFSAIELYLDAIPLGAAAAGGRPPDRSRPHPPSAAPACVSMAAAHGINVSIIFDDFSAISPQWPLDCVSLDIFVTA